MEAQRLHWSLIGVGLALLVFGCGRDAPPTGQPLTRLAIQQVAPNPVTTPSESPNVYRSCLRQYNACRAETGYRRVCERRFSACLESSDPALQPVIN